MSSIAAGANSERTNRWLLIGAVALAVVAGILVFLVLANSRSNDSSSSSKAAVAGDKQVLVAKDTIAANTTISAGMFEVRSVPASTLVVNPASDETAVIGKVTRAEVLKGEQLSFDRLGISRGAEESQLAFSLKPGERGVSIPVSGAQVVAGLVVPDDRVDLIATYQQKDGDQTVTRIVTLLQNIRVLALAQTTVQNQPSLNAQGTPIAQDPNSNLSSRPDDVKPDPGAGTATLALTPDQVQIVAAALNKGSISLALRGVGDDKVTDQTPYYQDDFGPIPRPVAP